MTTPGVCSRLAAIALACTLGTGCIIVVDDDDDRRRPPVPEYDTLQDFVDAFADVYCSKLGECGQLDGQTVAQCVEMFVASACEGGGCDAPRPDDVTNEEVQRCIDDVADLSCPVDANTSLPPSCDL
jgi:hypothetical protein